ncbi:MULTISPECIES: hypothetical protein [unclassified Spirillospora]|uniref:hypothetical protein n=1 Tax=unclassified Spirillospora TaxID=2642701 RepID=UPI003723AD16
MRARTIPGGFLFDAVGVVMLVAGPAMVARAAWGRKEIRGELATQEITFPDESRLPTGLTSFAGQRVETGPQARAYADLIKSNLAGTTAGRTYAQLGAELAAVRADGGEDEKLTELQRTAFTGEMLRASLMSAYQAWQVTLLAGALGALFTGLGAALLTARGSTAGLRRPDVG